MRVNIIQPKDKTRFSKKRVCAYARVSTESEKQGESFENQVAYYEKMISLNPEYEFVGVFADRGITGTTDNRPEFKKMLALTEQGKIDLIITKSISRFARNTTVMLEVVRELKNINVEVKFEKENISTLSGDGEFMLTVLASFAQEESKNISDNIKWRIRSDFKKGKFMINTKHFLGYDRDKDGGLIINEEQAAIVRKIYDCYVGGMSTVKIARTFAEEGIKTLKGKDRWTSSAILVILKNEKYKGDVLCQKTYMPDHLSRGTIINQGKLNQYYIKNNHDPIVSEEVWEQVQQIMAENRNKKNITKSSKYNKRYPLSGMLFCSKCGATLKRRIWNSKLTCKKVVWQCTTYIAEGVAHCPGTTISDELLQIAAIKGETIVKEEIRDGKKYYSYTSKGEQNESSRRSNTSAKKNGRLLPGVDGPGRTTIKL